ncbi:hypothetical protein ACSBR2_039593 [Camellia fascicularis]
MLLKHHHTPSRTSLQPPHTSHRNDDLPVHGVSETIMGVAFTKYLIHLYASTGSNDLRQHVEIEAHAGQVNDLAFAHPNKQLCVVTCGDDKMIKVWDLIGRKIFNFEGHEALVYSICPHHKENVQFIFSTAIDGKIKAWLADGSRLFSCGTSRDGDSFLVEWNESEGAIKRTYYGFIKKSNGVVQFDTTQNHFLAVGEDNQIKFWEMDTVNVLTSTDAEGGLPSLPRLRFNKEALVRAIHHIKNRYTAAIIVMVDDHLFLSSLDGSAEVATGSYSRWRAASQSQSVCEVLLCLGQFKGGGRFRF